MSEFFNKVKSKAKEIGTKAKAETIYAKEITTLNVKLKVQEGNLGDAFEKLGKLYFAKIKANEENDEQITEVIAKCEEIEKTIDSLNEEIAKKRATKKEEA